MPLFEPSVHQTVIEAASGRTPAAAYQGQRHHTVYLPARWFAKLAALRCDKGAASHLQQPGSALELMPVPGPSLTPDAGTPGDLVRLMKDFGAL